jgi:hypothetical protein
MIKDLMINYYVLLGIRENEKREIKSQKPMHVFGLTF